MFHPNPRFWVQLAALSDARSVLSIAISHNMDNITSIGQADLAKYMGLTKGSGGNPASPTMDASESKRMVVDDTTGNITYQYRRGGVTLIGTINVGSQQITWQYNGLSSQSDANRITALREGLKLAQDGDLTENTTTPTWT